MKVTRADAATPARGAKPNCAVNMPAAALDVAAADAVLSEASWVTLAGCEPSAKRARSIYEQGPGGSAARDLSDSHKGMDIPMKEEPHVVLTSLEKPDRRPLKFCSTRLNAALVQSVQVTFEGTFGTVPATIWDATASMLDTVSVPVYGSRLLSVSVKHRVLLLLVLRMTRGQSAVGTREAGSGPAGRGWVLTRRDMLPGAQWGMRIARAR